MNNIMVSFTHKKRARDSTQREEVIIIDEKLQRFGGLYISFFFFFKKNMHFTHSRENRFEFPSCQEYPDISPHVFLALVST